MEPNRPSVHNLTSVELDVLRLIACGFSYSQIARMRGSRYTTVSKTHARHIFQKLGVNSQIQAALYAWRTGIISLDEAWQTLKDTPQ